jgi:hypothetical protein
MNDFDIWLRSVVFMFATVVLPLGILLLVFALLDGQWSWRNLLGLLLASFTEWAAWKILD